MMTTPSHPSAPPASRPRRGLAAAFSLVETMMATGIVSTAVLGTVGLLATTLESSQEGQLKSRAIVVVQEIFHDLQIGAIKTPPAAADLRQTKSLHPNPGLAIPRTVFLYDQAGIPLPAAEQPAPDQAEQIYAKGSANPKAAWIAVVEGVENPAFTASATTGSTATGGSPAGDAQVIALPVADDVAPLERTNSRTGSTARYAFATPVGVANPAAPPPLTGLTQVRISVESPPGAPVKARKKFAHPFLWNR